MRRDGPAFDLLLPLLLLLLLLPASDRKSVV